MHTVTSNPSTNSIEIDLLHDQIVVRPEKQEVRPSGIITINSETNKLLKGEVVACGPGRMVKGFRYPLQVKLGDRVVFGEHSDEKEYHAFVFNNEDLLIMREADIVGIIE